MKDETKIQAHIFKKPRSLLNVSFGGTAKSTPMRKPHTVFDSTGKAQPLRKTGCFWQKLIKMMLRCDFQRFTVHIDNVLCSVAGIYNIMHYCLQFSFFFLQTCYCNVYFMHLNIRGTCGIGKQLTLTFSTSIYTPVAVVEGSKLKW